MRPKALSGARDHRFGGLAVGDAAEIGDGPAAGVLDLLDDFERRRAVGARAAFGAPQVVDDDFRALAGHGEREGPTDAAPRAGDQRRLAVDHAAFGHLVLPRPAAPPSYARAAAAQAAVVIDGRGATADKARRCGMCECWRSARSSAWPPMGAMRALVAALTWLGVGA